MPTPPAIEEVEYVAQIILEGRIRTRGLRNGEERWILRPVATLASSFRAIDRIVGVGYLLTVAVSRARIPFPREIKAHEGEQTPIRAHLPAGGVFALGQGLFKGAFEKLGQDGQGARVDAPVTFEVQEGMTDVDPIDQPPFENV
jgi:hypothetical protein